VNDRSPVSEVTSTTAGGIAPWLIIGGLALIGAAAVFA